MKLKGSQRAVSPLTLPLFSPGTSTVIRHCYQLLVRLSGHVCVDMLHSFNCVFDIFYINTKKSILRNQCYFQIELRVPQHCAPPVPEVPTSLP